MEQQKLEPCGLSQDERLSLWKSRPWRHRLEHRWNVVRALFGGQITLRSAWLGLNSAHEVVFLAIRRPASRKFKTAGETERSMLVVCPLAVRELRLIRRERFLHIPAQKSKDSEGQNR